MRFSEFIDFNVIVTQTVAILEGSLNLVSIPYVAILEESIGMNYDDEVTYSYSIKLNQITSVSWALLASSTVI